jgi:hypothetical protein
LLYWTNKISLILHQIFEQVFINIVYYWAQISSLPTLFQRILFE